MHPVGMAAAGRASGMAEAGVAAAGVAAAGLAAAGLAAGGMAAAGRGEEQNPSGGALYPAPILGFLVPDVVPGGCSDIGLGGGCWACIG